MLWFAAAVLVGVVATLVVSSAWSADAAPGDDDATYVPWPGCRLTDTRADSQIGSRGTKLGADEVMTVEVHGNQGECVDDLAIPTDAVGLATNVTVVDATAQSNIRVYRGDLTVPPLLSNLNVTPGAPPTPNKVDTQLAPDGTLKVYNFKGSVNIVIDVVGYYTPQSLIELAANAGGAVGPQGPAGPAGPAGPPGTTGRILMSEGVGPDRGEDGVEIRAVGNYVEVGGSAGDATKYLRAPSEIGGLDYRLTGLAYCMVNPLGATAGKIREVVIVGVDQASSPGSSDFLAIDSADREGSGCWFIPISDPQVSRAVMVHFSFIGPLNSVVQFESIRSIWEPVSS